MAKKSAAQKQDDNLGSCAELQRAMLERGKAVAISTLAELSHEDRDALWSFYKDGIEIPEELEERLGEKMSPSAGTPAAGRISKMQMEMLRISDQICILAPEVRDAERKMDAAKKRSTEAAKDWQKLVEQLTALNMQLVDCKNGQLQKGLPLDYADGGDVDVRAGKDKPVGTPALAQVGGDMKAMRALKLGDFVKTKSKNGHNLSAKILAKLAKAKVKTIGDLKDDLADVDRVLTSDEYDRVFKFIGDFPVMREK